MSERRETTPRLPRMFQVGGWGWGSFPTGCVSLSPWQNACSWTNLRGLLKGWKDADIVNQSGKIFWKTMGKLIHWKAFCTRYKPYKVLQDTLQERQRRFPLKYKLVITYILKSTLYHLREKQWHFKKIQHNIFPLLKRSNCHLFTGTAPIIYKSFLKNTKHKPMRDMLFAVFSTIVESSKNQGGWDRGQSIIWMSFFQSELS